MYAWGVECLCVCTCASCIASLVKQTTTTRVSDRRRCAERRCRGRRGCRVFKTILKANTNQVLLLGFYLPLYPQQETGRVIEFRHGSYRRPCAKRCRCTRREIAALRSHELFEAGILSRLKASAASGALAKYCMLCQHPGLDVIVLH